MEYIRDTTLEDNLLREMQEAMYEPDRGQPSVSGMIYCLTKTYLNETLTLPSQIPSLSNETLLLFATGLGLEKVILSGRQVTTKGEHEGISYHIDHIGSSNDFIEMKSTRISSNKPPEELSSTWIKQILAYFKAKGITSGHLVVLHLMGDYKPPFPQLRAWALTATQKEIDDNWTWLQQRAITYLTFVKNKEMPTPYQFNEDWECSGCSWSMVCQAYQAGHNRMMEL